MNEVVLCRKRFYEWAKERDPSFRPMDVDKYYRYYEEYLTRLNPWQIIQEARVASLWKYEKICKLVKFYKDVHNEDWPLPSFSG